MAPAFFRGAARRQCYSRRRRKKVARRRVYRALCLAVLNCRNLFLPPLLVPVPPCMYVRRPYSSGRRPVSRRYSRAQGNRYVHINYPRVSYARRGLSQRYTSRDRLLSALRARGQVTPDLYPVDRDQERGVSRGVPVAQVSYHSGYPAQSDGHPLCRHDRFRLCVCDSKRGDSKAVHDDSKVLGTGGSDGDSKSGSGGDQVRGVVSQPSSDQSLRQQLRDGSHRHVVDQLPMDLRDRVGCGERTDDHGVSPPVVQRPVEDPDAVGVLAHLDSLTLATMPGS